MASRRAAASGARPYASRNLCTIAESALILATASSALDPMIAGFRNPPSASRSRVRTLPSQVKRKFNAALNTVGVLNGSSDPLAPRSRAFAPAPFVLVSWHEPQLSVLSCDRRGSRNSCSPSATRRGSSPAGAGIGVIGSAPDDDRTVCTPAVHATASAASANKDAFRAEYAGQETIVRAHRSIIGHTRKWTVSACGRRRGCDADYGRPRG